MSVAASAEPFLTSSGRPVSTPLKDVRTISRQMVGHFIENVVPCATLPGEALDGDITTVTRVCLELTNSMLDGRDLRGRTERVQDAAADWAREGIPIDTIHHAIHEGFKLGFDLILENGTIHDFDTAVGVARRLMDAQDMINSAVSVAYVRELRSVVSEHHTAVHTLTSALLGGQSTSTMARECGIEVADRYHVVALELPPHPEEQVSALDEKVVARRKLRRVQAELANRCAGKVLSLLSVDGGTLLLPATEFTDADLDALIENLSRAGQVPIRAVAMTATPAQVPAVAEQVHELVDIVHLLGGASKVYRPHELAFEYQLTRPGPARDYLSSVLDSLEAHPELLTTLEVHMATNMQRSRSARRLFVHTNTVDYRLKRIGQITGFDPNDVTGLCYLRAALLIRAHRGRSTADVA
ncbi:PucR family transcriptional regulator [Nocardia cyriacigeorgica]|uniref:PucR family transcriptional regulator n=2 Tax=Nocardia cyriacigeorgica TaxID=135487 RepID=A0A6P1CK36_9NOCA|nr:helix-turn-helix domain-containing protein [Nocardia cyriacigeorgica]MBF6080303.1 helix-turn-helix domain-containing protein [Nocardia cyriacigeorgica]MBF6287526.1 helix-turn-helix domain-containing protein [Nocardia cyriacigeorgica]MBF6423135.1 helix-turn-helix domain-containing protein [Nocardia cyriacigeorgica]NEW32890.1 PucR family transcriptional regulator [Nocardia cyriacigeorgica]BDT87534.1 transcriptional regulator [Nocardia cyriacigeorgica]